MDLNHDCAVKETDLGVYLKLQNRNFSNLDKNIIFACVYIPCEGSSFYTNRNEPNGIENLFDELITIMDENDSIVLMGDLNSRTSDLPDFIKDDSSDHMSFPDWWASDNFSIPRKSLD